MLKNEMQEYLYQAVIKADDEGGFEGLPDIKSIKTFEEAGILSATKGLVIKGLDGSEYQISIVKSR